MIVPEGAVKLIVTEEVVALINVSPVGATDTVETEMEEEELDVPPEPVAVKEIE